jgi:hypothetical protein
VKERIQHRLGASSIDCFNAFIAKGLSSYDQFIVWNIAGGCMKSMASYCSSDSLFKHAKFAISRPSKKVDAAIKIRDLIIDGKLESFRPSNLYGHLPKNFRKNYELISRALQFLLVTNIVSKDRTRRRDGSGPDSHYIVNSYVHDIRRVLSVSESWRWVFSYLLESGVLSRYTFMLELEFLYSLKFLKPGGMNDLTKINKRLRLKEGHSPKDMLYYNVEDLDDVRLKEMASNLTEEMLDEAITQGDSLIHRQIIKTALSFPDYNLDMI